MRNVLYTKGVPRWVSELNDYQYKQITLAGTINPNPEKYRMVPMPKFDISGVATLEEIVDVEISAETEEEAKELATKEVLQTHPEYESVEWVSVNNAH